MALSFPYTYISCPCSDASRRALASKRASREIDVDDLDEEEQTFDPRNPRSNFSLFPPENLYYCEECHDLKCSRCIIEEIVCWYCPACLFEQAPSSVKSDNNRCPRNCFICPICQSQLSTTQTVLGGKVEASYILSCNYCMWSTLDIGIHFAQPSGIRQQLDKIANGGTPRASTSSKEEIRPSSLAKEYLGQPDTKKDSESFVPPDSHSRFNALKSFYKEQLLATDSGQSSSALDAAFSSPSSLTRIMNLYGSGAGLGAAKKAKPKSTVMREALTPAEGLKLVTEPSSGSHENGKNDSQDVEKSDPSQLQPYEFDSAPTPSQLLHQMPLTLGNPAAMNVSSLRPMPHPLRTKRSKRCAACKHILVKPELKVTSTRYRINLIALKSIPHVTLKPVPVSGAPSYLALSAFGVDGNSNVVLPPGKPSHWVLTLRNPLYENVKVSLGSPSVTPGKWAHKVTILCPQFSVGKNGDVWDDVVGGCSQANTTGTATSMTAAGGIRESTPGTGPATDLIAGKVYESGRNWTSVVLEIVPAMIIKDKQKGEKLGEDEDVIEIPIRVRLEWKVSTLDETQGRKASGGGAGDEVEVDDGSRELSYWMVLGVGKVIT